jgi:hypothetical protein
VPTTGGSMMQGKTEGFQVDEIETRKGSL